MEQASGLALQAVCCFLQHFQLLGLGAIAAGATATALGNGGDANSAKQQAHHFQVVALRGDRHANGLLHFV